MLAEQSRDTGSGPAPSTPISFAGAMRKLESGVCTGAASLRHALARRDADGAWSCFQRLRALLTAHLTWEADDLPGIIGMRDLIDLPGETRSVSAWHDLLIDALSDVASELSGPALPHTGALVRVDHDVARLVALVEDYCADVCAGLYRTLDEDVEVHDAEALRRRALDAWARRTGP